MRLIGTDMCIEKPGTIFSSTDTNVTVFDAALLTPLGTSTFPAVRSYRDADDGRRIFGWRVMFGGIDLFGETSPGSNWIKLFAIDPA